MKSVITVITIAFASVISAGCTIPSAIKIPTGEQMIGTWTGTSVLQENGKSIKSDVTFLIDQASGQSFSGTVKYRYVNGRQGQEPINGSIGKNGNIVMADQDGFYVNGLLDIKSLSLQYIEASPKETLTSNINLQRQ